MFHKEGLIAAGIVNCRGAQQELRDSVIVGIELFKRDNNTSTVINCPKFDRSTSECTISNVPCAWTVFTREEPVPVKEPDPEHILRCITGGGEFVLDTTSGEMRSPFLPQDHEPVTLTPFESAITEALMRKQGI